MSLQQGDSNHPLRSAERSRTEELSRYLTLADDDDAVLAGGVAVRPGYEDFSTSEITRKAELCIELDSAFTAATLIGFTNIWDSRIGHTYSQEVGVA